MTSLLPLPEAVFSSTEMLGKALDSGQRNLQVSVRFNAESADDTVLASINKLRIRLPKGFTWPTHRPDQPGTVPASHTASWSPSAKPVP